MRILMRILGMGDRDTAEDPVCGMQVDVGKPPGGSWSYGERDYYFCAPGCNRAFQKDPQSYLSGEKRLEM